MRYQLKKSIGDFVLIQWAHHTKNYKPGDCLVVARKLNEAQSHVISCQDLDTMNLPMSLEDIHAYITAHPNILGSMIHDCRGIVCDDEVILFNNPIHVSNRD